MCRNIDSYRGMCNRLCEPDFEPDGDVDGSDALTFKGYFGRNQNNDPCDDLNPWKGDFDCGGDCDWCYAFTFKRDLAGYCLCTFEISVAIISIRGQLRPEGFELLTYGLEVGSLSLTRDTRIQQEQRK